MDTSDGSTSVASGRREAKWRLDAIDFEILRHKLWSINDEAATVMNLISASTVANEVKDMNCALMTPEGDVFVIGTYIAMHAITLTAMVKFVREHYSENPGIREGDIFLCNDPYIGACHQSDVAVFSPIFHDGELIAWSGLVIHQVDIGGPVEGSVQVGAKSIYGEQPLWPPVKIGERGELRKDLEFQYLRMSRLPRLTALDLRAKVAANLTAASRIRALVASYGLETFRETMHRIVDTAEIQFRAMLRELPDGRWAHRCYLDTNDEVYRCVCYMTKRGDRLSFDFSESSPQAPAVFNTTRPGLEGRLMTAVMAYLCYDIGWCPAGVLRALDIHSKKGTIVDAEWPGGCSKATTAGSWAVDNLVAVCVGKMLAASEKYRFASMAGWMGAQPTDDIFGMSQWGTYFGGTILDQMGGGGARTFKDGIDTGGFLCSISIAIANVEDYEFQYPILYLYRKQLCDSGGPGKFRGGATITNCYIPHNVEEIPSKVLSANGVSQPEGVGIFGGYPSCTNQYAFLRDSNVRRLFEAGTIPQSFEEMEGRLDVQPAIVKVSMAKDDVYRIVSSGGGGYLDPLERDPELVRRDVVAGLVSVECARDVYGVVFKDRAVDERATVARRDAIRKARLRDA